VGGLGVAAGLVTAAIATATVIVALGLPAESRADDPPSSAAAAVEPRPTELVVALALGDPVMQAGAVRGGGEVVLARGLEVEIVRSLARRLGIPRVRFTYVRPPSRLLAANAPWHLTIASIRAVGRASSGADLSDPYLGTDQAVVLRRGLAPLATLAALRSMITCAVRGSDGARAIAASVRPSSQPVLAPSSERLLQLVQTGVCDAALVDAHDVGRFVEGRGVLLGPVRARVAFGAGYVVAVTRGGPVAVAEVNRTLARMRADGTMHRLARAWLGIDPARLRPLG
jgi:ABC-type amino acid transport substrate-binding protein